MSEYDFALQWLDYRGIKVYNRGKQILKYNGDPQFEISPLNTSIQSGVAFADDDEEAKISEMSFLDLERMGFMIRIGTDVVWNPGQRVNHRLVQKQNNIIGLTWDSYRKAKQLTNLTIENDAKNRRIRLKGNNVLAGQGMPIACGVSDWVYYGSQGPKNKSKDYSNYMDFSNQMLKEMYGEDSVDEMPDFTTIPEIPVLLTDDKYIVCMPKMDTPQRILIVGASRQGKSVLTNALAGRVLYKWEERVGWLMDPMNQLHSISLPQDYSLFNKWLETIGEEPKPIPAVQLYIASKGKIDFRNPDISLLLTLSFRELLYKYKIYSYGIDDWKIEGSTRYITEHIDKIMNVKDPQEIYDIMERVMEVDFDKDQGKYDMVKKWVATFKTIFDSGFISNLYKDSTDELTIYYKDGTSFTGHPFIALLEAGCVPVVNTSNARSARWVRNYLADMMYKIYYHQMTSKPKKRVWIINDEMNEIYENRNDMATKNFETYLFRQAAFNNIGFIGNSQSLEKLNKEMFNNSTHVCCFYLKDSKDRKRVRQSFGGSDLGNDSALDSVMRGLKKYEMVMFVNPDQHVVVYDRWGRRKEINDKIWWKGKIFPPLNHHHTPKQDEKKSEDE